ncbi:MAG: hypothetical protein WCF23_22485 [Candidatus Nitrosopolaris sp.]
MTRAEKEQYVIELYKQGRTIREIAKLMHMSFGEIGKILKKFKKEAEIERGHTNDEEIDNNEPKSKESKAFKLFSEGKTPVQVVIALDIAADEVRAIYRDFMHQLVEIYDEIEDYLPSLLRLHRLVKNQGMGEQEIVNVLKLANSNEIQLLQERVDYLRNQLRKLEIEVKNKEYNLSTLDNRMRQITYRAIPLGDKSIRHVSSYMGLTRRNDFTKISNGYKINHDSDTEVIYASGEWHNVIR